MQISVICAGGNFASREAHKIYGCRSTEGKTISSIGTIYQQVFIDTEVDGKNHFRCVRCKGEPIMGTFDVTLILELPGKRQTFMMQCERIAIDIATHMRSSHDSIRGMDSWLEYVYNAMKFRHTVPKRGPDKDQMKIVSGEWKQPGVTKAMTAETKEAPEHEKEDSPISIVKWLKTRPSEVKVEGETKKIMGIGIPLSRLSVWIPEIKKRIALDKISAKGFGKLQANVDEKQRCQAWVEATVFIEDVDIEELRKFVAAIEPGLLDGSSVPDEKIDAMNDSDWVKSPDV